MRDKIEFHLNDPTWCPGCGNYATFEALKRSAASLDIDPKDLVVTTGIGCHGRLNSYFNAYGFHGLHGRVLPVASGIKLSNPHLKVIGVSGDGDSYSIGMNHFIHAIKRNISITYLVVDNRIFALTQGQTSPTSRFGFVSSSTPYGSKETPIDGLCLALAVGGTFVARGFSGDPAHLSTLITKGINHKGFALIEVLSPCIIHNKFDTYVWFRKNIDNIDLGKKHDPSNKKQAMERVMLEGKIPVGLIYQEEKPSFEELVFPDEKKPIVLNDLKMDNIKFEKILNEFK